MATTRTQRYYVEGMQCASCELAVERRLKRLPGVKTAQASVRKGEVYLTYEGERPSVSELNRLFREDGYTFYSRPPRVRAERRTRDLFITLALAAGVILALVLLNSLGLAALVTVNASSALPAFFLLGLLGGVSSCGALAGGLVLSLSQQWSQTVVDGRPVSKFEPHLLFNLGRLSSYALFGVLLGLVGSALKPSLTFSTLLGLVVCLVMIVFGLRMLGVRVLSRLQFPLPRALAALSDPTRSSHRLMPFGVGAATFFLPCGLTASVQGVALLVGNPLQSGLILLLFALGSLPALLLIGFSSIRLAHNRRLMARFSAVAGMLLLFLAFYNLNAQLNALGLRSLSDLSLSRGVQAGLVAPAGSEEAAATAKTAGAKAGKLPTNPPATRPAEDSTLPPIVDGKQILKMDASASGYRPNRLKVRAGIPVRWEITDKGTSGCTNAIIARQLFSGEIELTPGQISVQEFTPEKAGRYKFSCWMGMVSGVIEVVDTEAS